MSQKKVRYTLIDVLRGISVICMVIYHTLWDLVNVHSVNIGWFTSSFGSGFQVYIRWSFILISGFSLFLGKRKIRRGVTVLLASVAVTAVTALVTPVSIIKYGVLTFLGAAMLACAALERVIPKIEPIFGLSLSVLLFILLFNIERGLFGIGAFSVNIPKAFYANEITAFLGFPYSGFYSSDYVPLFPWIFLYFAGVFLFCIFRRYNWMRTMSCVSVKPLEWVGRNALPIYLIHQPLIYGVLYLVFM